MNPNKEVAEALSKLQPDPRFQVVQEWLRKRLQSQRELNDGLSNLELSWGQGHAQELSELLGWVDKADGILENFARGGQRRVTPQAIDSET